MTERKTIAELLASLTRDGHPTTRTLPCLYEAVAELLRREAEREAEKRQRHLAAFERFVTDPNNARAMQQLAKTEAKGPPFLCKDCNWPIPICHCGTGNLRSAEAREHLARKRAKEPDE